MEGLDVICLVQWPPLGKALRDDGPRGGQIRHLGSAGNILLPAAACSSCDLLFSGPSRGFGEAQPLCVQGGLKETRGSLSGAVGPTPYAEDRCCHA